MNTNYLIISSIALGSLILLSNYIDFGYIVSKLFFRNNSPKPATVNSKNKEAEFLHIVSLWYQLKEECDEFKLTIASDKLDEVFPLLNGVLEDEFTN